MDVRRFEGSEVRTLEHASIYNNKLIFVTCLAVPNLQSFMHSKDLKTWIVLIYTFLCIALVACQSHYSHLTTKVHKQDIAVKVWQKKIKTHKPDPFELRLEDRLKAITVVEKKIDETILHTTPSIPHTIKYSIKPQIKKEQRQIQSSQRKSLDDNKFVWILMWTLVIFGTAYTWYVLGGGCIPWIFMGIAWISMLILILGN